MSQESVEAVRQPLRVRERSSRSLAQRMALRFPRGSDAYARILARLPPTSRFRQAALRLAARDGVEAWNRRDLDASLIAYHPDSEHYPPREFVEAGLWEPCYRGRDGYARLMASWADTGTDARLEPIELIDNAMTEGLRERGAIIFGRWKCQASDAEYWLEQHGRLRRIGGTVASTKRGGDRDNGPAP